VLPLKITQDGAEDFPWWSDRQPPIAFEKGIGAIIPQVESWSTSMRMWGVKHGDEAYVCYLDDDKSVVEEIGFRVDVRALAGGFVRDICAFTRNLKCVLLTGDYEILIPEESMVLAAISHSTSKKYLEDPVSTLKNLDTRKFEYGARPKKIED
jgi:hypothetical protein